MCCKKPGLKIPNTPPPTLWKSSIHAGSAHITCRKTVRMCSTWRLIHFRFLAHSLANAISALTDKGLRYAGYGVAVNHDADSHISPAPELMEFHLKTREAPLFAVVNTPEKQPDHLFRSLGFNRTWDEWRREEDARTHATERRPDRGWSQGM